MAKVRITKTPNKTKVKIKAMPEAQSGFVAPLKPEPAFQPNPLYDAMANLVMSTNRDKNFVQRTYAQDPRLRIPDPYNPNEKGAYSSHLMGYSGDNAHGYQVYPEVVESTPGKLEWLGGTKDKWAPLKYAQKTGEYIPVQDSAFADYLSNKGYKRATGILPMDYPQKKEYGGKVKVKISALPEAASGLSVGKAKEMLRDGTVHGKPLTDKQKRYFGYIAGGGTPQAEDGLQIGGNGSAQQISANPYTGNTLQFSGPSHANGGIPMAYNGTPVEVEGNETAFVDRTGQMNIMGNMRIPGTKTKFKNKFKEIAEDEEKANKQMIKGLDLVQNSDPYDQYESPSFTTGRVKSEAARIKQKGYAAEKESLSQLQNSMLDLSDNAGVNPRDFDKSFRKFRDGGMIPKAAQGASLDEKERNRNWVRYHATQMGLNPDIAERQVFQESGWNHKAYNDRGKSPAYGMMQMTEATGKAYGRSTKQMLSNDPADVWDNIKAGLQYYKDMRAQYNNDDILALAAYNGGPKAVQQVQNAMGRKNITGQDLMDFYEQKRQDSPTDDPNARQNQTYDYINNITKDDAATFFGTGKKKGTGQEFREQYYSPLPKKEPKTDMQALPVKYMQMPSEITPPAPRTFDPDYLKQGQPTAPIQPQTPLKGRSKAGRLPISEIAPELATLFEQPAPVPHLSYQPDLYSPYQVSFQDRLNSNASTFRQAASTLQNNPEALAVLAADKYNKDNEVHAEQFRTNQEIQNRISNENVQLLNQAQLQNLQMQDLQAQRQAQAIANTDAHKRAALTSIADKFGDKRRQDISTQLYESMSRYRYDPATGQYIVVGPAETVKPSGMSMPSTSKTVTKTETEGDTKTTTKEVYDDKKKAAKQWGGRLIKKMKY
jgi:soluble lytic murein transglycosylase-like protein